MRVLKGKIKIFVLKKRHNFLHLPQFVHYSSRMDEKEVLTRLLLVEHELDARKNDALTLYNREKTHQKQMAFHKCQKRNRWVFGGNRSGKTECGAVECVWMALGMHPFRQNRSDVSGWVVSLTQQVQRDVAQAKILKYLPRRNIIKIVMREGSASSPEYGIIDYIVVKNALGGTGRIGFRSCDQGREKLQGMSLDFVWFDEEPPKDIYDECRMRVFDRKGDIFGTMTPLKGLTWVYDEIELNANDDPEVWCEYMEWRDNPYLDESEVTAMEKVIPKTEQLSRRFGKFTEGEGLVYPEFDQSVHVIDPFPVPHEWQANISIDPGLRNPTSCHFYAVDFDGVIYVVAEHFEAGKSVDHHVRALFEIADAIGWRRDSKGRLTALIDSAANQRTLASEKSVAELFAERGVLVNTNVNKDLYSGIQRIKSLFEQRPPKIYIFSCCVNLIRELKSYWWGDGDRPKKIDDHALDELRYFVMTLPPPAKLPIKEKTPVELDKERLMRGVLRQREWTKKL